MINFVLSGSARSGTTVVAGALIEHPAIQFYGELLNDMLVVRQKEAARITLGAGWQIATAPNQALRACGDAEDGYDYLEQFYALSCAASALGFKLLYDQAAQGASSSAWRYLAEHREIRILRTRRDNLLDIVCSYARARMTRRWHSADSSPAGSRFVLPVAQCEPLFRRFASRPAALAQIEHSHRVFEIDFDAIENDFSATMNRVFEFLELDPVADIQPRLKKIGQRSPAEEIVNYVELKAYFEGSPYARYFVY